MRFVQQLKQIWNQLGHGQRAGLAGGCAVIVLVAVLASTWAARPRYEMLFGNLESGDAGRIVDELRAQGSSYRLGDGGRTVLVPRNQVYDLRMQLASQGIPNQGTVGYEIFDKNTIGMTNFVQRLNFQRALEGELARTIEQLEEIDSARIHVVIPEPSLFSEEERRPTASVLVRVRNGRALGERQVQGIRFLVAASVEGLVASDVTVVDAHGKMLGRQYDSDEEEASSRRVELQRSVESYLANKARQLLEGVLGTGKALVQVNADLDFERVERTIESYDGENPVVRSEERSTTSGADSESGESVVTNYEISRTLKHVIGGAANLKRLSVAVMVDGVYVTPEDVEDAAPVYQPRSQEELERLRGIVENAVGIDSERGDRVTIESFAFDRQAFDREQLSIEHQERMRMILELANKLGIGLVIVLLVLMARKFLGEARKLIGGGDGGSPEQMAAMTGLSPEELRMIEMQSQIHTLAREHPERVALLVRSWLHEGRV